MTEPNDKELQIFLPPDPALVDGDVITVWKGWLEKMAGREIERRVREEGAVFDNDGQIAWETSKLVLQYVRTLDIIADSIYHGELMKIARAELFRYAAEGWTSLQEVLEEVGRTYESKGTRHQIATWAGTVAPWCNAQGIAPVGAGVSMSTLMEGASALNAIIAGPGRMSEKKKRVAEELKFLQGATRDEARARYRTPRDEPGVGVFGKLVTGETVLMIVAQEDTAEALKQRMGALVHWAPTTSVAREVGEMRASKVDSSQVVRTITYRAEQHQTEVFDAATGNRVEVLA